jgi:multisubunit Na+/H+ antiporter MnhB subunit
MIAGLLLDLVLAALLIAAALRTLTAPSGFDAVIGFVAFGLLLALGWVRLGAVDVALTEAAIGAGATGLMLLMAAVRLAGGEAEVSAATPGRGQVVLAGLLAAGVTLSLALAVLALPAEPPGLAAEAIARTPELALGNPVAAVLMGFRGLDTLLESVVLVFAVLAIWSMAPDALWGGRPGPRFALQADGPLGLLARLLPPIGIVIGIHIAWIGADAPGGKFQGGAVLAAMWALAWIAGLVEPPSIADRRLRLMLVAGPGAFLLTGFIGWAAEGAFLAWPAAFAKPMILLVEVAMTISVAAAIAMMLAGPPERAR